MNILNTIVQRKKEEVAFRKKKFKENILTDTPGFKRNALRLSTFVMHPEMCGIIAEFKRRSPSKPDISLNSDVEIVSQGYSLAGASALSVLTDIDFFGGSDEDLQKARLLNHIPILRKEFIIDPYQVIESKSMGADAILLIAEILTKAETEELSGLAAECGLEVLLEIHTTDQLNKYNDRIRNIGVNNRDLKTFRTDIQRSLDVYPQLPADCVKISESGLDNPESVITLKNAGYHGFLIGEKFMKSADPGAACANFIQKIKNDH
jgi:indole-3-glycerol phosphate synthase